MLTRSGWGMLLGGGVLLVVGIALGYSEIGIVGAVLVAAVGSGFAWVGARARVEVERHLDRNRVTVGDVALAVLTVTNSSSRPVAALTAQEQVGQGSIGIPVPRLAAGKRRTVRYQLPTQRRCVLAVGPLRLVRSDPFGLVRFEQSYGAQELLYVHPRRHALRRLPATLLRSLDGPTTDTAPRGTVVFHALREYVAGDDRRHIHWRSSAHLGDLLVRQYVDTSLPDLTVVVDNACDAHDDESFEEAIEVVASVVTLAADSGFPVRITTTDGQSFVPSGPQATQQALDHLAGLEQATTASLTALLDGLRAGGNTLVVVARELGPRDAALLAMSRSHYRSIIAITVDPAREHTPVGLHPAIQAMHAETATAAVAAWNAVVRA